MQSELHVPSEQIDSTTIYVCTDHTTSATYQFSLLWLASEYATTIARVANCRKAYILANSCLLSFPKFSTRFMGRHCCRPAISYQIIPQFVQIYCYIAIILD